jgi:hypothetical protein
MKTFGERVREWFALQTPLSLVTLIVGASGLSFVLVGTPIVITLRGWTPDASVLKAIGGSAETGLLSASLIAGGAASIAGFSAYRRMPTKPARKAAISGAALGVQALIAGGLLLLVRSGENFAFLIRQNLRLEVLDGSFWRSSASWGASSSA